MIGAHIELILIVTGAITAIALFQFIAPRPVLRMIYDEVPTDEVPLALNDGGQDVGRQSPRSSFRSGLTFHTCNTPCHVCAGAGRK